MNNFQVRDGAADAATKVTAFLSILAYLGGVFPDLLDRGYDLSTALTASICLTVVVTVIAYAVIVLTADKSGPGSHELSLRA